VTIGEEGPYYKGTFDFGKISVGTN